MVFYKRSNPPSHKDPNYTYLPKQCMMFGEEVIPNCIGYTIGRIIELTGSQGSFLPMNGDKFYDYHLSIGIAHGVKPKLGAVACWKGHTANVEEYTEKTITISQSHYNGCRWDTEVIGIGEAYHGMEFQGFLYLPVEWDNEHQFNSFPPMLEGVNYYRVRKSWTDVASQLGAYHSLNNAMAMAQTNPGYHVYSPEGKLVPLWY